MAKAKPPSAEDYARELMQRAQAPEKFAEAMMAVLRRAQAEAAQTERAACAAIAENIEKRWRAASRIGLQDGDTMADAALDIAGRIRSRGKRRTETAGAATATRKKRG